MQFTIRRFRPDEPESYKTIRLEALTRDPGCFGNSYELEAGFPDAHWQRVLADPLNACFGLYAGDVLIGLTSIFCRADTPGEGYLTQSYIRRPYRGRGLASRLYETRIAWARDAGLTCLVVGHRAGNLVSKAANQRHGFQYSHREPRRWPDGVEEDMIYYKLYLTEAPGCVR